MAVFKIKYLFELYPTIDFTDDIFVQNVTEKNVIYESQATKNAWSHITDLSNQKRIIQTVKKTTYEAVIFTNRSIDYARMSVGQVTVTTDSGEQFIAHDVKVEYEESENDLTFKIKLTFSRYDNVINMLNHNSAKQLSGNRIEFTCENPPYIFNNIDIYSEFDGTNYIIKFDIPVNNLTDYILAGDIFYIHTDNKEFNALIGVGGDYLFSAVCKLKDVSFLYFNIYNEQYNSDINYNIRTLIIDSNPDGRGTAPVTDRSVTFNIYSLLNPFFPLNSTNNNDIERQNGIKLFGNNTSYEYAELKVWLEEENLYLFRYLQFAKTVKFITAADTIICEDVEIENQERRELIRLYEFDVKLKFNHLKSYK